MRLAAALALAAPLACARPPRPGADPLEALSAAGLARSFVPRLSITMQYRPCGDGAGACTPPPAPSPAVLAAAERASAAAEAGVDPRALHAAGLMDLLWTRGEGGNSPEPALERLEAAARLSDRPAAALADLAAARLLRAGRTGSARDLLLAYEAAARALEHEPRLAAALFNRALALDRLGLADEAALAWNACAAAAPGTGWAAEARERARTAAARPPAPRSPRTVAEAEALAAADPQRALQLGMDSLLGEWGRRAATDPAGARAALELAGALGMSLERRGGDASLARAMAEVRAARGQPGRARAAARAHADYAAARARYEAGDYAAAGPGFERVAADPAAPATLRRWALLFRGATRVYAGRRAPGERDLRAVAAAADPVRTPALAGRARWSVGTTLLRAGRYPEALAEYRAAQALLARAGEREHLGAVRYLEGETRFWLGDADGGYDALRRAAWTLRPYRGSLWLHNLLVVMADAAAADGLPRASLGLRDAGVAAAALTGRPVYVAEARLARATSRARAGDPAGAAADLDRGARAIAAMAPVPAAWFGTQLRQARAAAAARTDPARSAAALDSAVAFFAPGGGAHLLRALVARADARLALGDANGAAADLERATGKVAELGGGVAGAAERAALLDAARAVFDRMVMLRGRQGRAADALAALERGRASLAAAPRAGGAAGAPADGGTVVEYALIGDTLLIWTVSGRGVRMARAVVGREALRRTVERARWALETGNAAAARGALAALYDRLVRPVRVELGPAGAGVGVVADGEVAAAPFAALLDTARGRWLVEDHALRFAPSLRDARRPATHRPAADARALVVADPAFDPAAWPGLRRLAGAAAEADSVAAIYPGAVVLAGAAAGRTAFERALPGARVVHYAGHALADDARPAESALVLAPSPGAPGRLTAAELGRLPWGGVRLVVLSACHTLRPGDGRAEGFAGLSGALLAAGAGGVVGSTGQVDDATTRALMAAFHRAWRQSGDGPGALRQAQLRLLRSADPALRSPAAWGTFRYTGS